MSAAGFPYTAQQQRWWFATHGDGLEAEAKHRARMDAGDRSNAAVNDLYEIQKATREAREREMRGQYGADNPFADKAVAARLAYERAVGKTQADDAMARSFPLGGGVARPGAAVQIDSAVNHGLTNVRLQQEMQSAETKARAFDVGGINAHGHLVANMAIEPGFSSKTGASGFHVKGTDKFGKRYNVFTESHAVAEKVLKRLSKGLPLRPEDIQP